MPAAYPQFYHRTPVPVYLHAHTQDAMAFTTCVPAFGTADDRSPRHTLPHRSVLQHISQFTVSSVRMLHTPRHHPTILPPPYPTPFYAQRPYLYRIHRTRGLLDGFRFITRTTAAVPYLPHGVYTGFTTATLFLLRTTVPAVQTLNRLPACRSRDYLAVEFSACLLHASRTILRFDAGRLY